MPSSSRTAGEPELRHTLNELSFLYDLTDLLNRDELTQEVLGQTLVDRIVAACQVSEIMCARLALFDQVYATPGFAESPWQRHSNVVVNGAIIGKLTVGRLDARPAAGEGPFLTEEGSILDQCTRQIGQAIQRRQRLAALTDREQLLDSIVMSLPDTICIVDDQGIVRYMNRPTAGSAVEEVLGQPVTDFVFTESHQIVFKAVQLVLASGAPITTEVEVVEPKGVTTWYELRFKPLHQKEKSDQVLMVAKDISQRKAAQVRVRESEERYQSLFDASMDAILIGTPDGSTIAANPAACALFGRTEEELIQLRREELVDAADPRLAPSIIELAQTGRFRGVHTFLHKDGSRFEGEIALSGFADSAGRALVSMFIRDITDKLHAEQALAEQEAYYRQAIDAAGAVAYKLDHATSRYTFISPQAERLTGCSPDELTSERFATLVVTAVPRGQFAGFSPERALDLSLRGECDPVWECDYHIRTDTDEERWLSDTSVQIRNEIGKPTGTIGILQDITERVRNEAALRASEEKYRLLAEELERRVQARTAELQDERDFAQQVMDALGQGLAITDNLGRGEYVNPFLADLLETTPSAMLDRTWTDFLPPEELSLLQGKFLSRRLDQHYNVEAHLRTASGDDVPVLISTTPHRRDNEVVGRITVFTDLTEIKEIEKVLRRSRDELRITNAELEKAMRMKDEFLASMSHELRTPLAGILGLCEVLQLQHMEPLSARQLHAVKGIAESGEHLLSLINDILDVARLDSAQLPLKMESFEVQQLCTASLSLVRGMARKKEHDIAYVIKPAALWLYADPRRLKQMLVNLLSNAVKFTPRSGRLGLCVLGDEAARVVRFVVWDEGIGIAAEHRDRLFQPFMQIDNSLSREHSGTGLGLTLVKHMADLHGGTIEVESTPGVGSTFTLTLPWRQAPSSAELTQVVAPAPVIEAPPVIETSPVMETPQGAAARILVAEDDALGAEILVEYLTANGHTVDIAHNGREALYKANELLPDVILMDVRMPLLDGLQAIAQLRASANPRLAGTPIIAVTAQAMRGDAERCIAAGANAYVAKPYQLANLLQVILEQLQ